jgi:hypothetical protein
MWLAILRLLTPAPYSDSQLAAAATMLACHAALTVMCPELANQVPLEKGALVGQKAIQQHLASPVSSCNVAPAG